MGKLIRMDKVKNFKELTDVVADSRHYGDADCPSGAMGYFCTLDAGHNGPHEAAGSKYVCATWETEPE